KHAFDLACEPEIVAAVLGKLAAAHPGLRVPGTFDGFELALRAVIGQQISVRAARTMLGRVVREFGDAVPAEQARMSLRLVAGAAKIAALAAEEFMRLGMTRVRAGTLLGVARAIASGEIRLEPESEVDARVAALMALPGIGAWTANYIAMRALRWPDTFL